ncbi:MAG: hypothetical protein M1376_18070, partial [Planctomycetes bacterium]|nr:hypothetical protein [Planctomycetota bacterium]
MVNIGNVIPPRAGYAYTYDKVGNRQDMTVTDSGGTKIHVYTYDDSGNMTHDGTYTYDYDPENRLIRVTKSGFPPPPPTTLAEALDLPLVYTTGGTREWLVNGSDYHTGLSSANSDNLNNAGESSWVETTVQAVGSGATLSFWWMSTEEGEEQNNTLDFRINGVVQSNGTLHGNSGPWEQRTYTLAA